MMSHMRSLTQALCVRCTTPATNGAEWRNYGPPPLDGSSDRPAGGSFGRPMSPKDGRPIPNGSGVTVKSPAPAPALDKSGPPLGQLPAAPPAKNESAEGAYNSWFLSMKQNLEHFGDVEVFVEEAPRECNACFEMMVSPYRIRPRKCSHVFHIECLLQWWTEGSCPVCRTSFAPEDDPEQAAGESQGGPRPPALGNHATAHSSMSQRGDEASLDLKRTSPRGTPMRGGWSGPSLHGAKPPL
jgi:hypothetical protein